VSDEVPLGNRPELLLDDIRVYKYTFAAVKQALIFGTSADSIDTAENRYKFSRMLDMIDPPIEQPKWRELTDIKVCTCAHCRVISFI
jgi:hypothetical protein